MRTIADQAFDEINQLDFPGDWICDSVCPWDGDEFGDMISRSYKNSKFYDEDDENTSKQKCQELSELVENQLSFEVKENYTISMEYKFISLKKEGWFTLTLTRKTESAVLYRKNKSELKDKIIKL